MIAAAAVGLTVLLFVDGSTGLACYQCANTDGKLCPYDAATYTSTSHDACIAWKLGNGSVILQNLVSAAEECTEEKINFWSRFIDLYYNAYGGSVSCCYSDLCNDGKMTHSNFVELSNKIQLGHLTGKPAGFLAGPPGDWLPGADATRAKNGNCEKYYEKISADEWMPDILIPLAFDRASQTKVGVFYTKLGERNGNNDHVTVRVVNRSKQNLTMYSIKLFRVGSVSIHVNKLEPQRNGGGFVQQDGKKTSVNDVVDLDDQEEYQGFWISIKDDVTISVGKIGDKLIDSVVSYSDVLREGPDEPYYFGLTTPTGTSASFGVNCDMPGLHFPDTCVTDNDCEDYPETSCGAEPLNSGLDPGIRTKPFKDWEEGDTILKSCWCKEGRIRIPESRGCYDPIRKVVTLRDACFANYHCDHLPNTLCSLDTDMPKYNMSCQCVPGHKPFESDPRTGLVEGCAPLTTDDKGTIAGCSRRFSIEEKMEWVPTTIFPLLRDENRKADVGVFFVSLGKSYDSLNNGDDTAVIRLMDEAQDRRKMLTIKMDRKSGKIALYESKITRNFFFSNENDREVAQFSDIETKKRLENGFVGFWVQYRYEEGYGGHLSVGLNGSPFTKEFAVVKWTDSSTTALPALKYIGFTTGDIKSKIEYGANCVLLNSNILENFEDSAFVLEKSFDSKIPVPAYVPQREVKKPGGKTFVKGGTSPWSYIPSTLSAATEQVLVHSTRPEHIVLEPAVLKGQYLTKLKRLLPTYFNDGGDDDKIMKALDEAYRSI